MSKDTEKALEADALKAVSLQKNVEDKIQELKQAQAQIDETWRQVEAKMIEHDIKTIKGEWGSLTIAERLQWEYDPTMLAPKFFKKVVDTKRLSDTYRLEDKIPKGATPKYTKYLTKRIK